MFQLKTNNKKENSISHIIIFLSLLYLIYLIYNQGMFQPDVKTYIAISNSMEHIYDTKTREPLIIWLVKIFYIFENEFILRLSIGLFFILSTVYLNLLFEKLNVIKPIKYIGLCSYAFNPYLVSMASTAVRDITILFFISILNLYLFCNSNKKNKKNIFYLMLACIFLPLIKIHFFLAITIILLFISVLNKSLFKSYAFIVLLSFLFLLPFLIYSKNKFDDPFHSLNVHVQHAYNSEKYFISKNQPIPNSNEEAMKIMSHGMYGGNKIGALNFIFGENDIIDLGKKVLNGNFKIIFYNNYQFFSKYTIDYIKSKYIRGIIFLILFIIPIFIGVISLIFSFRKKSFLVFIPFVFANFSVISAFWLDPRLFSYYYLFISIWWTAGFNEILLFFKNNKHLNIYNT